VIVYVESNFVLELAFLQEEHHSCDGLITLAESHQIELVIPAFSIAEPYDVLVRRSRQRTELYRRLVAEMRELSRSRPYAEIVEQSREITSILIKSGEEEKQRLDVALGRILECEQIIPIGAETLKAAIQSQEQLNLSPQDSIVYASVVSHLSSGPTGLKCFLNKNSKDFVNPDIQEQLARYNCRLITKFADGLGYIRNHI
jgi:predicted nucleic acid-binding protein